MAAPSGPVEDGELDTLFSGVARLTHLGIAVSGGPDSTALLVLLDRWSRLRGAPAIVVLTVDHGLRPEARVEAEAVAALAARLGRPARLLAWDHPAGPPGADIQAAARAARYRLLAEAAQAEGLAAVALAHTLDDKAETFLLRLARGSGLQGLAAMPAERTAHGVRFVRPLLGIPKARLEATLREAGFSWAEDPSNRAERFLRARIRSLMPALAGVGLTAERLAATADRLARADLAVEGLVEALAAEALADHGGVVSLDPIRLAQAPDEVALRLMDRACGLVRPGPYPPRAGSVEAVLRALRAGPVRRRTLGGVVADPRRERLWLYAEAGRRGFPHHDMASPGTCLWDGRFSIEATAEAPFPLAVRAAEGAGRRPDLPSAAAASLPMVAAAGTCFRADAPPPGVRVRPVRIV